MPYLIHIGAITNNQPVRMAVLCQLITQGNGIAIAGMHAGKGLGLDISGAADYIKNFSASNGRKFKAVYTFPNANFGSATGWPRGASIRIKTLSY